MCVGQLVARLEGETMMAELARKVAKIEIAGPVKRRLQQHAARAGEPAGHDNAGLMQSRPLTGVPR